MAVSIIAAEETKYIRRQKNTETSLAVANCSN